MKIQEALEIVSLTHPGMVRSHNEDSVAYDGSCGLVVLADGMGGYNAGEVASGIAVSVVTTEIKHYLEGVRPEDKDFASGDDMAVVLLRDNVQKANASIFHAAQSQPQYAGMGTTIVSGLFYDNRVAVAHVGDSRMYRLRGDVFESVTRDHSLLQEQIDSGMISKEDARLSKNKNLVTRAVGIDAEVVAEVHVHDVQRGDIYLLCSDGLNDMVEDEDIGSTVQMLQSNLPLAASQLIQMANDNGGRDNVSVILVKIKGEFAAKRGLLAKLLSWFKS
ncbi:MAG TPA: Stp1/IreP family PP2C-type Ser/Thr phosphatase [Gallionellaceae bacterium]|nr:Stp1/IreP family PP2C-type Ser/Thr phosphatase [Gallionellaceae bacterium]